jgi:hypothetical protein
VIISECPVIVSIQHLYTRGIGRITIHGPVRSNPHKTLRDVFLGCEFDAFADEFGFVGWAADGAFDVAAPVNNFISGRIYKAVRRE